jgi:hypothetical protein
MSEHDAREMFYHAEHIYFGNEIIAQRRDQTATTIGYNERNVGLYIPMAILSAFATEIYLKCLLLLETGSFQSGHDLRTLFDALDNQTKTEVRTRFDAHASSDGLFEKLRRDRGWSMDFDWCLDSSRKAFNKFRYLYETPLELDEGCFVRLIMNALRETIVQRFPTWERPPPPT